MAITVIEAAESYDFYTLESAKSLLGVSGTDDDELLTLLITATSDAIREYTGQEFARENIEETVAGFGSVDLLLTRSPIESVNSVLHDGEPIVDYSIENPGSGMLFREVGWSWTVGLWWSATPHPAAGQEAPKFTVDYWAGYWLPSFTGSKPAAAKELPGSLRMAFIELLGYWYREQKQGTTGMDKLRIGDYSVSYGANSANGDGIPNSILAKLKPWVRII